MPATPGITDRLDRDVLGLSGLTHVIWLEGINDIGAGTATASIIPGYQNVVGRLHGAGIKVYGATLTSALGISGGARQPTSTAAAKCRQWPASSRSGRWSTGAELGNL